MGDLFTPVTSDSFSIDVLSVEIKALKVGKKQVTQALFRQLPQRDIIDEETGEISACTKVFSYLILRAKVSRVRMDGFHSSRFDNCHPEPSPRKSADHAIYRDLKPGNDSSAAMHLSTKSTASRQTAGALYPSEFSTALPPSTRSALWCRSHHHLPLA